MIIFQAMKTERKQQNFICFFVFIIAIIEEFWSSMVQFLESSVRTKPDYIDGTLHSIYEKVSIEFRKDKELNEICHYNDVIIEAEKALADNYKGKKQEIVLLINDNKVRGKGLGKRLIDEFCLTDESHTPTILCSDKDSNYHFYEHLGFRIIDNKDLPYSLFDDKKVFHSFLFIKK